MKKYIYEIVIIYVRQWIQNQDIKNLEWMLNNFFLKQQTKIQSIHEEL